MNSFKKKNNQGLSLVEILISMAIIGLCSLISLMMMRYIGEGLTRSRSQETLTLLKQKIINTLSNQASWDKTITLNPSMSCRTTYPSSCPNGTSANINLFDSNGNKIIDSTGSVSYRRDGSECPAGSSLEECPLSITLGWKISCSNPTECKYPVDMLQVNFYHDPTVDKKGFNSVSYNINWTSRKSISNNSSPLITCTQSGKTFIGIGQSLTDSNGVLQTADSNGCISLNVFKGPRGFTGVIGPQGLDGPKGPTGVDAGAPVPPPPLPPPPPPTIATWCGTSPKNNSVCTSFLSKLGRQPDLTSANYYLDMLNSGGTVAQIELYMSSSLEALGQTEAGKYTTPSAVGPNGIELGFDVYPGGTATVSIKGVSVSFTIPPGKKLTPEEAYSAYIAAAKGKGLDTSDASVAGTIEKTVINDVATKIKKSP